MGLTHVLCMGLLAAVARTQGQDCTVDTTPFTVGSSEDAATLATYLNCSNGDFSVQWTGEVFVTETIHVTSGTSLNITGAEPGAIADGQNITQLFYVDGGSRLHLSEMTLAHGSASDGGAISVVQSSVSFSGNTTFSSNSASFRGGAISALSSNVSWDGDGNWFSSNSASSYGGAIYASFSTVSWDVDDTRFSSNSANGGGAIFASSSTVSWDGDGTVFTSNSAYEGGAIYAMSSNVSWDGDRTQFNSNLAGGYGGAIYAYVSSVSWDGDSTHFNSNSADFNWGGAIYLLSSSVLFWNGDDTRFSFNSAFGEGGAISSYESTVSWTGNDTEFSSNNAVGDGGAIYSTISSKLSWDGNTTFINNVAEGNGGALALIEFGLEDAVFTGATFVDNSAGIGAGALYLLNSVNALSFGNTTFQSNSAGSAGGAVAAYVTGTEPYPAIFWECNFLDNEANGTGGAVDTLSGYQEFSSCGFEGNSAAYAGPHHFALPDVGGAMRLGGTAVVRDCSFLSNSATNRGFAIAVVASADVSGSSFDKNDLNCTDGLYREDTEGGSTSRFAAVCLECPDWAECSNCTITRSNVTPTCEAPFMYTTADEDGATLETLTISRGYWRATKKSENILACYNVDACSGGKTGEDSYCAPGYKGPYCAVCETNYSPLLAHTCTRCSSSRHQGVLAATVITALVAALAVLMTFQYMLSSELEERSIGCVRRKVLLAVPVQALKIIIVVWQILTQVCALILVGMSGLLGRSTKRFARVSDTHH